MVEKIKLVAVSYLNTIPFLYGIEQDQSLKNQIALSIEYPSLCADLLIQDKADISLIPIAEIPNLAYSEIIGNHCIGANGKVNTVMLYSDCPLDEITSIALDYQSRTSVMLSRVLSKFFWKIDVDFENTQEGYIDSIKGTRAGVVIGDRAFDLNNTFTYQYDLSEEWSKFTNLPFVFACWVANKALPHEFKLCFSKAIEQGVNSKVQAIEWYQQKKGTSVDLDKYLNADISYELDDDKRKALDLFLDLASKL